MAPPPPPPPGALIGGIHISIGASLGASQEAGGRAKLFKSPPRPSRESCLFVYGHFAGSPRLVEGLASVSLTPAKAPRDASFSRGPPSTLINLNSKLGSLMLICLLVMLFVSRVKCRLRRTRRVHENNDAGEMKLTSMNMATLACRGAWDLWAP